MYKHEPASLATWTNSYCMIHKNLQLHCTVGLHLNAYACKKYYSCISCCTKAVYVHVPAGGLEGLLGAGRGGRGLPATGAAAPLPALLVTFTLLPPPSVSSKDGCDLTGGCPCPDSFITAVGEGSFTMVTAVGGFGVVGESTEPIFFTVSPS